MEVLGEQEARGGDVYAVVGCEDADEVLKVVLEEGLEERADAMRCQVKITTRHNLQLRMANYTDRDVYVRLLGHGDRISGTGLSALKDCVHLSPLKPSVTPEEAEMEEMLNFSQERREDEASQRTRVDEDRREIHVDSEDDTSGGAHTISDTAYSPCASLVPTPVEEAQGGLELLFQSPARLLKELHADPDMQRELQAERQREAEREAFRQSLCSPSSGRQQMQACLRSAARLVLMATGLLMILLPLLLVLLESDLDISFLHDIRQTPEFEQFHYEYYCPLRRWFLCKLQIMTEHLSGNE